MGDLHSNEAEVARLREELARVTAERDQLARQRNQFQGLWDSILESTSELIFVKDLEGRYVFANSAMAGALNQTVEEMCGKCVRELVPAEVAEQIERINCEVLETGTPRTFHFEVTTADRPRKYLTSLAPWHDPDGHLQGLIGVSRDVTESAAAEAALKQARDELEHRVTERTAELQQANARLEAEMAERQRAYEALQKSEEDWRSLVENAPDIIIHVDRTGTIQFINRVVEGFEAQDVIGASMYDYIEPHEHERVRGYHEHVFNTGEPVTFEIEGQGPRGGSAWYRSRIGPIRRDGEVVAVTVITTDITERKQAEVQLQAEERLLRKLIDVHERERRLIAYEIHDGMLQDLIGANMLLETIADSITEPVLREQAEHVQGLMGNALREGRRMINDLRPLFIDDEGIVSAVRYLIEEDDDNGLEIDFHFDHELPRLDPMMEGAIYRIVQEALTNVKRHAQANWASIDLAQSEGRIEIVVQDDGVGFDPHSDYNNRFGLRGIEERCRLFGGEANVQTAPGEGTRIEVQLPILPNGTHSHT